MSDTCNLHLFNDVTPKVACRRRLRSVYETHSKNKLCFIIENVLLKNGVPKFC